MKAADWDRKYEGTELGWTAHPNRFLEAETADLTPGRALDLACGAGRHAVWLAELGWQVTAIDFSPVAAEKGRLLAEARGVTVSWTVADLLDWQPGDDRWELVILFYLQLAAGERRAVVGKAAGAVAPGGTFLLVGHDVRNLERGYGGPKSAEVLYTPEDVAADLTGSGLELVRAEAVERTVDTPEGERVAIDALVRAYRPE